MTVKPYRVWNNPLGIDKAVEILESTSEVILTTSETQGWRNLHLQNPESSKAG